MLIAEPSETAQTFVLPDNPPFQNAFPNAVCAVIVAVMVVAADIATVQVSPSVEVHPPVKPASTEPGSGFASTGWGVDSPGLFSVSPTDEKVA